MLLYHSPASPFVRKVMVLVIETGQVDAVTIVPASGTPLDPGTMPLAQNPLGKIPCLERDDGPSLYDSRVICRFLDHRAGGKLYPAPPRLWETLTLEATADGILEAAVLMRYEEHVRAPDTRSPAWIDAQWRKVARTLDVLGERWLGHLHGPRDMGQVGVGCALGYLDFRHASRNWRDGRPALAEWFERFSELPAMQATKPA